MPAVRMIIATGLLGLGTSALSAPQPPSLATEWSFCRAQFSAPSSAPADKDYPGGISDKGTQLTPPTIPRVTTVTVKQAECLMERMGKELVVAGVYSKGDAVPYSYALPFPGTTQKTFTERERALVAEQIETVAGKRMDRPVLVYCHHESCMPSHNAAIRLVEAGYKNVFWMREGIKGWKAAGLRVASMNSSSTPARGRTEDEAVPRREYKMIGYTDYPQPPWLLDKNHARFMINGKEHRADSLCLDMGRDSKNDKDEKAAAAGLDLYEWQSRLYEMAQVDPRVDNDVVERRKMQAFWGKHGERIYCSTSMVTRVSLLKFAMETDNRRFVNLYLHEWRLPVNAVDYTDGFTPLDQVINKASRSSSQNEGKHDYNMLRSLGAMTREEAEAAGVNPTERQLQARYIKEYRDLASAGNLRAGLLLAAIFTRGEHADANQAEADRWWAAMERNAIDAGAFDFMADTIGYAYMRWESPQGARQFKPLRPQNDQVAMQWFKRSAEGKSRSGAFYYGRGLAYGWGGYKDDEGAVRWLGEALLKGEDLAAIHLANLYARRGDVKTAARYGRSIHPMAWPAEGVSYMKDVQLSIKAYFEKNGLSWCGERAPGLEARPMSECSR